MAVDKLVDSAQLDGYFTNIASAIRSKAGVSSTYTPSEMPQAIQDIPSGGGGDDLEKFIDRTITSIYYSGVTIGAYAFASCSNLMTVNAPNATTISASAFYSCKSLYDISFPNVLSIYSNAFGYCSSIVEITDNTFPSLTTLGTGAFAYLQGLERFIYSVRQISEVSQGAFQYCAHLSEIEINCRGFGQSVFQYDSSLTKIYTTASFMGSGAFSQCRLLSDVSIPNMTRLDSAAFYGDHALSIISLPKVSRIMNSAFTNCSTLFSIYVMYSNVVTLDNASIFRYTPISTSSGGVYGSIFVPASLYNRYLTATNWSLYSSRIVSVTE